MNDRPHLPTYHQSQPPLFAVGSRVLLRSAPHGEPGTVLRTLRGMVHVRWASLSYTGHHKVAALVAADAEVPAEGPQGPQDAATGMR